MKRTYSPDAWRIMVSWGFIIFNLLLLLFWILSAGFRSDTVLFYFVPLITCTALYRYPARARVEVSPQGLRAIVRGSWLFAEWSEIAAVIIDGDHVGFETNSPVKGLGLFRGSGYSGAVRDLARQRRYIPLDLYRWNFFHGDFVETVEQLAPHVALRSVLEVRYPNAWKHGRWTPVE